MPEDYEWLKRDCEHKMEVLEPGFTWQVLVDVGGPLYDPMLGWADPDHSFVFCDIGGQPERGWNPEQGHGAIYRLHADGRLETIVSHEKIGPGMPMSPRRAPAWFGDWEGTLFFPGQSKPGRAGALSDHYVWRVDGDHAVPFSVLPHSGTIGDGIPGALCIGGFAPQGSEYEGTYFCNSLMNCTIYAVTPDGKAEVFMVLDKPNTPAKLSPYRVFWADSSWGEHEGTMMIAALTASDFEAEAPEHNDTDYYLIEDGKVVPKPVAAENLGRSMAVVAPPEFGPFGGDVFYALQGSMNQMHVTKMRTGSLPWDEKIIRIDRDGNHHVFADKLQGGGWNELLFDGDRLIVSSLRRSYSTGEYHEPDGSIYDIRWTG